MAMLWLDGNVLVLIILVLLLECWLNMGCKDFMAIMGSFCRELLMECKELILGWLLWIKLKVIIIIQIKNNNLFIIFLNILIYNNINIINT